MKELIERATSICSCGLCLTCSMAKRIEELEAQNERQVREIRNLDETHRKRIEELEAVLEKALVWMDDNAAPVPLLREIQAAAQEDDKPLPVGPHDRSWCG